MLEYPDGCLTAGYPIRLGAVTGAKEVLASTLDAPDGDPSDDHFAMLIMQYLGLGMIRIPHCAPTRPTTVGTLG